jgi:hypothetical protein
MFKSYEFVNKCRMLCSYFYEFVNFSVAMFLNVATCLKAEQ